MECSNSIQCDPIEMFDSRHTTPFDSNQFNSFVTIYDLTWNISNTRWRWNLRKSSITAPPIYLVMVTGNNCLPHLKHWNRNFLRSGCQCYVPDMIMFENLSLFLLHCTFTVYWPRVHSMSQCWNLGKQEMAAPPGQFIALPAINALKETISG